MIVHFWNELPNLTVYVSVSRVDGDEPKKIIRLGLKEGTLQGAVIHTEKLTPKQRCKITFEQPGQNIELQDASGFVLGYARVGDHEGIFRIQDLRQ